MKGQLLFVFLLLGTFTAFAQADKKDVREGNKLYKKEAYNEAEIAYRRALEIDSTSLAAYFNLGNALYKQKQYEQAENIFKALSNPNLPLDKHTKAKVMHNLGNATLHQEKWQESVDAYKQSLRLNSTDDETRTNLAYAQSKLEEDQQGGGGNDKNDENEDNKDEQNKDQQNQDNQQQQQQEQKISPQQAQQMLEAMQAKEKETQEKVKTEKAKAAVKVKTDKNW
ncbi:MAG: tetratricopeptide repeat protein [Prevotellaceae bacterium]|jgi:tetratricopeptide (TPR) repeat protein|nr:tetratricopeptide repeat protein [Prevotellaceae bacterium]